METRSADLVRTPALPAVAHGATNRVATNGALGVALLVLLVMPLVIFAAEGLVTARAIAAGILLGAFMVAAALYFAAALTLFRGSAPPADAEERGAE